MKVTTFLRQISDSEGPIQSQAAEAIERMPQAEFLHLMHELGFLARMEQAAEANNPILFFSTAEQYIQYHTQSAAEMAT